MSRDITSFFGKDVLIVTTDNKIFIGYVTSYETKVDSPDGIANIDVDGTEQIPYGSINFSDTEIKSIKEIE
ncbi:hypothetical protein [Companilactobacillus furfuricola]|uniref:hypothetical protein n=1 Tax=Companilactobacillus furfuricola TaxID=1462575 RepID=UPI000F7A9CE3|nr:hypothetical protein [Companilactobacillus furfuricola]